MKNIEDDNAQSMRDFNKNASSGLFAYYRNLDTAFTKETDPKNSLITSKAISLCEKWIQRRCTDVIGGRDVLQKRSISDDCFEILLRTLIFASRADGKIDKDEHNSIISVLKKFAKEEDMYGIVDTMLTEDLDARKISSKILFKEEAVDAYFIAAMILQGDNFMERHFLELFAATLEITPSLQKKIEIDALKFVNSSQF